MSPKLTSKLSYAAEHTSNESLPACLARRSLMLNCSDKRIICRSHMSDLRPASNWQQCHIAFKAKDSVPFLLSTGRFGRWNELAYFLVTLTRS
jgi:hypothetical protein